MQNDLLDIVSTRVIAPFYEPHELDPPMRHLNPEFVIEGTRYVLAVQFMATLGVGEFGGVVSSLAHERDRVTRAVDALLSGV